MTDERRIRDRITRDRLLLAAVLLVGIAGTGIVRRQLGVMGYNALGRIVFVLGYGGTVFVVWYGWIRPIEITGPDDGRDLSRSEDRSADAADADADGSGANDDANAPATSELAGTSDTASADETPR